MKSGMAVAVILLCCLLFSSCGGGSSSTNEPIYPAITNGNWSIVGAGKSAQLFVETPQFGGGMTQSGESVTAQMFITDSSCLDTAGIVSALAFNGTNKNGALLLKSDALSGQVISIQATLSSTGAFTGTYSVAGGCGQGENGTVTATYIPPITGTWTGSYLEGGNTVKVSAAVTESTTATNEAFFPLTGTVTFTGYSCAQSGSLVSSPALSPLDSEAYGSEVALVLNMGGSGLTNSVIGMYNGQLSLPSMSTLNGSFNIAGGACSGQSSALTLTKQ
jgi:hypothetical protein